jgi:hypothetical protein
VDQLKSCRAGGSRSPCTNFNSGKNVHAKGSRQLGFVSGSIAKQSCKSELSLVRPFRE